MSDITIIIPTSPRPSHPSRAIISATIASIKESLPTSPIIICCDGEDTPTANYTQFVDSLTPMHPDILIRFDQNSHQSGMLRQALENVKTPLIYYLEDDWRTLPDVPWPQLSELVLRGDFNSIKLHANPRVSPFYEHMMRERVMYQSGIVSDRHTDQLPLPVIPLIKTVQWSQNPHLASTQFYRDAILPMVDGKCDFIENIIHGIVANSPWEQFKTGIYNPPDGDMMRVQHLDGKGTRL